MLIRRLTLITELLYTAKAYRIHKTEKQHFLACSRGYSSGIQQQLFQFRSFQFLLFIEKEMTDLVTERTVCRWSICCVLTRNACHNPDLIFNFSSKNYFRDSWNVFDFIIVLGSLLDFAISSIQVRQKIYLSRHSHHPTSFSGCLMLPLPPPPRSLRGR